MLNIDHQVAKHLIPGTELGDGFRVGYGRSLTSGIVRQPTGGYMLTRRTKASRKGAPSLILAANSGDSESRRVAREQIKALTPTERAQIAPAGIGGKALERFVNIGELASDVIKNASRTRERDEQEDNMAKAKNTRKHTSERKARKPQSGIGTSEVAEAAGVSPRELRVFLRDNRTRFPKAEGRYNWPSLKDRKAQSLIKAVQKAHAEQA